MKEHIETLRIKERKELSNKFKLFVKESRSNLLKYIVFEEEESDGSVAITFRVKSIRDRIDILSTVSDWCNSKD